MRTASRANAERSESPERSERGGAGNPNTKHKVQHAEGLYRTATEEEETPAVRAEGPSEPTPPNIPAPRMSSAPVQLDSVPEIIPKTHQRRFRTNPSVEPTEPPGSEVQRSPAAQNQNQEVDIRAGPAAQNLVVFYPV